MSDIIAGRPEKVPAALKGLGSISRLGILGPCYAYMSHIIAGRPERVPAAALCLFMPSSPAHGP